MIRTLVALALAALIGCGEPPEAPNEDMQPDPTPDMMPDDPGPPDAGQGDVGVEDEVPGDECVTDEDWFEAQIAPVLEADCVQCHVEGGTAAQTRHLLVPSSDPDHLERNMETWRGLVDEEIDGLALLLAKPTQAVSHGGGPRFGAEDPEYADFAQMIARLRDPGGCGEMEVPPECDPNAILPGPTPLRRLTDAQYHNAVFDLLGVSAPEGAFPTTERGEQFSTFHTSNIVSATGAEGVLLSAEALARAATEDLDALLACGEGEAEDECARGFVDDFAFRAYRRPLSERETEILHSVLESAGEDLAEGVGRVIEVVLQSPQFLYLDAVAGSPTDDESVDHLDDHAIAARLSFFVLDTTPGPALLEAAGRGELHTRAQVEGHARRLVEDPRALPVLARFHQDWLKTHQLDTIAKSPERYPQFTPELVAEIKQELDLFITEVVWLGGPTLDTLLYSPFTWTTPALDVLYGTEGQRTGEGWERRRLDESQRPGVLGRLAFLTAHAYSETSAPVRRGAFVLTEMMCEHLEPPPNVPLDLIPPTETNTIRDRLAAHREAEACAGCHDRIDPVGFSFEHYGALGEWRTAYDNGIEVDATGSLSDPDGDFEGLLEMLQTVDVSRRISDCYATRWFEYANGRAATREDHCSIEGVKTRFELGNRDIKDLLVQIALTDAFRTRRSEETP